MVKKIQFEYRSRAKLSKTETDTRLCYMHGVSEVRNKNVFILENEE